MWLMVTSRHAGGVAPSGVSAAQDGTTITVTWIPPSPIPSAGYVVFYSTTGDEGSVSVSSGSDSQAVITGRQADYEYTVSVVALSAHLPSALTAVAAVRSGTLRDWRSCITIIFLSQNPLIMTWHLKLGRC